ncbi:lipase family protein [Nocardia nova]|uniref:lipase family protein n=1 Tax=Nocardia nova TaxID=37330 RepID=UPI0018959BE9|nr:lipase family protein [Nocardia nova]MBF6149572.1 alpha/beta hydrolase [Nocardia nova]
MAVRQTFPRGARRRWINTMAAATTVSVFAAGGAAFVAPAAAAPAVGATTTATELAPAQVLAGAAHGYAITYTTTDEHDAPATANAQVYLPQGTPPAGGWPIVSWAKGTVGIGDQCALSTTLAAGEPDPYAVTISYPLLSSLLNKGIAVVSSDYIGLGTPEPHHYLNTRAEAHAVIDAVRAATSRFPDLSHTWAAAGHSQGGGAALSAGYLADSYGADLHYRGTVALAPASNIETLAPLLTPSTPKIDQLANVTANLTYVLAGLRSSRPDLDLDSYLSPLGRQIVADAPRHCVSDERAALASVTPQQLISKPLSDPRFTAALRDYAAVPTTGYHQPVQIIQGLADTVVSPALTALLLGQLQAGATTVTLDIDPGAGHFDVIARTTDKATATLTQLLTS